MAYRYISAAATTPILRTPAKLDRIVITETAAGAITVYDNFLFGDSTTQFDITNPVGSTWRYTYDGTGTNPNISATTVPVGTVITTAAQNFAAGNNGTFTVTGSGTNYFEVTNASGVVGSNQTIGTGNIRLGTAALTTAAVFKASVVENSYEFETTLQNGLTVVTAAASKLTVVTDEA